MSLFAIEIISIILLIPGLVTAFIPGFPNLVYMFVIMLGFGIYDKFVHLTSINIIVIGIIVTAVMFVDFISGIAGAKLGGAHWVSMFSGFIGLIIGTFLIPVPILGSLIGMFLGILLSEWYRTKDIRKANKAAVGSFIGTVAGMVIRVLTSFIIFVLFMFFVFN